MHQAELCENPDLLAQSDHSLLKTDMTQVLDISTAFETESTPLSSFFQKPGVGYYIPLYQREYSWDERNVEQLMEDLMRGVVRQLDDQTAIHFLGAVILLRETNPSQNIQPQDHRALPPTIKNVIDGQQRICTLALLGCLLYRLIFERVRKLPELALFDGIREEAINKRATLREFFTFDLRRGTPTIKPIIIRGNIDSWTLDGADSLYVSEVSNYLAVTARAVAISTDHQIAFPANPKTGRVGNILTKLTKQLVRIEKAHVDDASGNYLPAWTLLEKLPQAKIWTYDRPELHNAVMNRSASLTVNEKLLCSIVQVFAFCQFLFDRSCFTVIEPTREAWAFDMFQSLNATGTPLTAIETFRPFVVNTVQQGGNNFKGSASEKELDRVGSLLDKVGSAEKKSKLSNEFLSTLGLVYDVSAVPKQFSDQRAWLLKSYNDLGDKALRERFLRIMGDLASYKKNVLGFKSNQQTCISGIGTSSECQLATVSCMFLHDSGHRMADTILSRVYSLVLHNEPGYELLFTQTAKAVAAFFALWRAALPNAGLDDVYRDLLKGDNEKSIPRMAFKGGDSPTASRLKEYLRGRLAEKGIGAQREWLNRATQSLRYDRAKAVCRFALFLAAHDAIPDPNKPGLMMQGTSGCNPHYLTPTAWESDDFKSIEHIAPQSSEHSGWDPELYRDDLHESVGNLTLLPITINSSAGNKAWQEKMIYYRHLAETNPEQLASLRAEAIAGGIELSEPTIELLKRTSMKHHMTPIVSLTSNTPWDRQLVESRTLRVCEIMWDRLMKWLS